MNDTQQNPQKSGNRKSAISKISYIIIGIIALISGAIPGIKIILEFSCYQFNVFCPVPKPVDNDPTALKVKSLPRKYHNATVTFARDGNEWKEINAKGITTFRFLTSATDKNYIYIIDKNRLRNDDSNQPFTIRIPIEGGMSEWGYPNTFQWAPLYPLEPLD